MPPITELLEICIIEGILYQSELLNTLLHAQSIKFLWKIMNVSLCPYRKSYRNLLNSFSGSLHLQWHQDSSWHHGLFFKSYRILASYKTFRFSQFAQLGHLLSHVSLCDYALHVTIQLKYKLSSYYYSYQYIQQSEESVLIRQFNMVYPMSRNSR